MRGTAADVLVGISAALVAKRATDRERTREARRRAADDSRGRMLVRPDVGEAGELRARPRLALLVGDGSRPPRARARRLVGLAGPPAVPRGSIGVVELGRQPPVVQVGPAAEGVGRRDPERAAEGVPAGPPLGGREDDREGVADPEEPAPERRGGPVLVLGPPRGAAALCLHDVRPVTPWRRGHDSPTLPAEERGWKRGAGCRPRRSGRHLTLTGTEVRPMRLQSRIAEPVLPQRCILGASELPPMIVPPGLRHLRDGEILAYHPEAP